MPNTNSNGFNIFVFGTLKKGFPNFYLNKGIQQNGTYSTEKNYLFYLVGERHTPCIYFDNSKGAPILGELYKVNSKQLNVLDELERTHKPDGYVRTTINIKQVETGKIIKAFIYLKMLDQISKTDFKLGPINCYTKDHTKLYQYRKIDS